MLQVTRAPVLVTLVTSFTAMNVMFGGVVSATSTMLIWFPAMVPAAATLRAESVVVPVRPPAPRSTLALAPGVVFVRSNFAKRRSSQSVVPAARTSAGLVRSKVTDEPATVTAAPDQVFPA